MLVTFLFGLVAIAAAAVFIAITFLRHRDAERRARAVKLLGFIEMLVFAVVAGIFIGGEAFDDPGGAQAVWLVLTWLVPLGCLAILAWLRPRLAAGVLIGLSAAMVLASVWFAVDPEAWRAVEDQRGPVRAVSVFVLTAALAVLGLKRTKVAGWLLIAVSVLPGLISSFASLAGSVSLSAVSVIPLITGVLYLLSARIGARSAQS